MTKPSCEDTIILKKRNLKNNYFGMTLGPYSRSGVCRPGCFIHLKLPHSDIFFRRAMSVAGFNREEKQIEIIFKVFGRGTSLLSEMRPNDHVDILGPLGVPFDMPKRNDRVIIVAGGVGFPPLMFLAEHLIANGRSPQEIEFFYGGRTSVDLIERARIKRLGVNFHPATDDGSFGQRGFVTEHVETFLKKNSYQRLMIYGCGPESMLREVDRLGREYGVPGQVSLEAPMPCGIGVCLGCVVPLTAGGYARVCADGPVFNIGEVML
ncbi:MAG: dihydroorotate dehydrogenase electron transfer subunit [Candidatus Zixiibacteriota bacterium]|jgi:dihydroorotate dehydrogenase electron transfer subunit